MKRKPGYLECRGEEWEKARMKALVRDDFTCQAHKLGICNQPCIENRLRFLNVHHIKERIHGGTHDLDNLITVCRAHHADIHPHMRFELAMDEPQEDGFFIAEL